MAEEKELMTTEEKAQSLSIINEETIDDFLFGSSTTLTDNHKMLFKKTALMLQLNPFKREIYAVPYKDYNGIVQMSLITGYEVYLKRAERSGKLDGWEVWAEGSIKDSNLKARIKIHRKDWKECFKHEVFYVEYVPQKITKIWREKPITMIKKVVTAQAFRLTFPDELGGMPYIQEEMENPIDITPESVLDGAGEVDEKATEMAQSVIQEPGDTIKTYIIKEIQWLMDVKLKMGLEEFNKKVKDIDSFGTQNLEELNQIRTALWNKHANGITIKKIKVEKIKEVKDETKKNNSGK